jgi:hypothetical protein
MEVLLNTYDIVRRVPAHNNQQENQFGSVIITRYDKLCGVVILCLRCVEYSFTRPTSQCVLFDGANNTFCSILVLHI